MTDIDQNNIRRLDGTLLLILSGLLQQRRTTAVAERLGLSQSAVSHGLARLRDLTGDPLFLRKPHGLEPTRRALELAPIVEEILVLTDQALGGGKGFDPAASARVFVVGASDFMTALVAGPLMRAFEAEAPHADLVFRFLLGPEALDALRRGDIDLALGRFGTIPEDLRRERLFVDDYCLVARAGHPAFARTVDKATFATLRRLAVSPTGEGRDEADGVLRRLGLPRRTTASIPRFLTAFALLAQTNAVTIAPRRLARRYAGQFGLALADAPFRLAPLTALSVRRPGARPDQGVDWLEARVREAVADEQVAAAS